ncbi:MAG TPA: hypothetical protein VII73_08115 [Caulobacteraceae bacterium]
MPATASRLCEAEEAQSPLPWFVKVSPEFYDDAYDVGFGWEGWAVDADDAVIQALEECHLINDRDPEDRDEDLDPKRAKIHVAEIDFRRFAGPLLHWARTMGGWETPLWRAMEAAVIAAGLPVLPLNPIKAD